MGMTKQVLFQVGEEEYGIDIQYVIAIEKYMNIVPIPNAPSYIEGIINLRGDVIPVYSLRDKFNLPPHAHDDNTKLIVANSKGIPVAFEVDMVKEIVEISGDKLSPPPTIIKTNLTSYFGQVAHVNDRLVILLNLDGILTQSEKSKIEELLSE